MLHYFVNVKKYGYIKISVDFFTRKRSTHFSKRYIWSKKRGQRTLLLFIYCSLHGRNRRILLSTDQPINPLKSTLYMGMITVSQIPRCVRFCFWSAL